MGFYFYRVECLPGNFINRDLRFLALARYCASVVNLNSRFLNNKITKCFCFELHPIELDSSFNQKLQTVLLVLHNVFQAYVL